MKCLIKYSHKKSGIKHNLNLLSDDEIYYCISLNALSIKQQNYLLKKNKMIRGR